MSLSASRCSESQKRTVSSLLAGRVVKRPKCGHVQPVQEAALRLLQQHQTVEELLTEVTRVSGNTNTVSSCDSTESQYFPSTVTSSLLVSELKREAEHRSVPLTALTVTVLVHRLKELTHTKEEELLPAAQRAQLCVLLESSRELLSQGALCPKLLWQELIQAQTFPKLELVFHLHFYNIITLKYILESNGVRLWLVSELKALCSWTHSDAEAKHVQQRVLTSVAQVLVGIGFDPNPECGSLNKRLSPLSGSILDSMLFWILETVEQEDSASPARKGAQLWMELFDTSLCGSLVSAEALQRYFTHCLTKTLTYKPRLTVSDAIALQKEWTFAKANQLLTSLFCQLSVVFNVEQLLLHLQQVLSTHEVNWKHVLSFLSTVCVYNPSAQTCLTELLNSLLKAAFESYDLESIITAFLLARQGALEGPVIFPSYIDWFKKSFGGSSSHHAASKKALVFLLKFLSDLVPFEPPQYLKVHILHPPFVPIKHRSLLMEYVSLAKTRLADLKESVEDMGLYEDMSAAPTAQAQSQEVQDVEKAVSLFQSTGRISATVMEASIFRRPYFLGRFLPALLTPRALPVKTDARMSFIEALNKADKIPGAQYASYIEACHIQRQQNQGSVSADSHDSPVDVLRAQLHRFRELSLTGNQGELSAQLSRMSHTMSVLSPPLSNQTDVIQLHTDSPMLSEIHVQLVDVILKSFCQCVVDTSRGKPNNQISWASRFVSALTDNKEVFSSLLHRLWDLFKNQVSSLRATHVLGLAVFIVHLHSSTSHSPLVSLKSVWPEPVSATKALSSALICTTHTQMLFCARFCVAVVCYGMCREDSGLEQYIPSTIYKKLLYLVPRLLPEARSSPDEGHMGAVPVFWKGVTDKSWTWSKTALSLWRNPTFQSFKLKPQYQLSFLDWLHNELQVCRGEDALSEPERQEYQQWACMELFLPCPEQKGGCGGDMRMLCCRLISAVLEKGEENVGENHSGAESCLPDVLSRLQECVYEMSMAGRSVGPSYRVDLGPCLLQLVSQRLSSSVSSGSPSVSIELQLHSTLRSWNRVLLALPVELLIPIKHEGGRSTLDCSLLIEHINQHQRVVCHPAGLLPCHLTTHLLKGVLYASICCGRPAQEVNKAWSQISLHCPLLLVSTAHWWQHIRVVLHSLWTRLCEESLPEQLQLLSHCQAWAHKVLDGQVGPTPSAPPLQIAACLYRASQDIEWTNNSYISVLRRSQQTPEVLVFLLSLCVNSYLSSLLHPQEISGHTAETCTALLIELVDCADWISLFKSERGVYQPVTIVTPDEFNRLMPWAFYSLLCGQSSELLLRAVCCPGFVHTAVFCYIDLLQLFLKGHTPAQRTGSRSSLFEPSQIVCESKRLLLRCISQMSGTFLSSSLCRQLQDVCSELDPELTAALRDHQNLGSLSPEMDFL